MAKFGTWAPRSGWILMLISLNLPILLVVGREGDHGDDKVRKDNDAEDKYGHPNGISPLQPLNAWKTVIYEDSEPSNRRKHTASIVQAPNDNRNFMLVFGGLTYNKATSSVLDKRECVTSVGNGTDEAALCCQGTATNQVWLYVTVDKYWLQTATSVTAQGPQARFDHSATVLHDRTGVLMYGGRNYTYSNSGRFESSYQFGDVWVFTLSTTVSRYDFGKWIPVNIAASTNNSPGARYGSALVTMDNSTFVLLGGCNQTLRTQSRCAGDGLLNDLWILKVTPGVTGYNSRNEQVKFVGTWLRVAAQQSQSSPLPHSFFTMVYTGSSRDTLLSVQGIEHDTAYQITHRVYTFQEFKFNNNSIQNDSPAGMWNNLPGFNGSIDFNDTELHHIHFDPNIDCMLNLIVRPRAKASDSTMFKFCYTSSTTTFPSHGRWTAVPSLPTTVLKTPFPVTLNHQTATFLDDEIILFGGIVDTFIGLESKNIWSLGTRITAGCGSNCTAKAAAAASLRTLGWAEIDKSPSTPDLRAFHASVTLENTVYIIGGQPVSTESNTSTLTFQENVQSNIIWSYQPVRKLWEPVALDNPGQNREFQLLASNLTYVIDLSVVAFNTASLSPELEKLYNSQYIVVAFGGFLRTDALDCRQGMLQNSLTTVSAPQSSVWTLIDFDTGSDRAIRNRTWPSPRRGHSAVMNGSKMYVFGGATADPEFQVSGELWAYDIMSLEDKWKELSTTGDRGVPTARFGHTAEVVGGYLYVFGGADTHHTLEQDQVFWVLDMEKLVWENLSGKLKTLPYQRFFHSSTLIGDSKFAISGGCVDSVVVLGPGASCLVCSSRLILDHSTWVFDTRAQSWQNVSSSASFSRRTAAEVVLGTARAMHTISGVKVENGSDQIVLYGGFSKCLSSVSDVSTLVLNPGCNEGYFAANYTADVCRLCNYTSYSDTIGSTTCTGCPANTRSENPGATGKAFCNLCLGNSFCNKRGTCKVLHTGDGGLAPICTSCSLWGYTPSDRCSSPVYYFILFGSLAGVLLLLLAFLAVKMIRRAIQTRRDHERALRNSRREISEMTDAWKIDATEIILKSRIDLESPGGFGEVWLSDYRDMKVAVKTISAAQLLINPSALSEMQQEMLLMRTLRHPNIVLFLGGGELTQGQGAFIVMEYMSRGTLTNILRDKTNHIDREQSFRFALDIAKGMRFIHSLTPPRLHRDLKSANCLVSDKWIVKIADFGASRLLRAADMSHETVTSYRKGSSKGGPLDDQDESFVELFSEGNSDRHYTLQSPLLGTRQWDLTTQIGTLLWRAPELWRRQAYGTPSDVYSFAIVLWEIWERKQPYSDRTFRNKFEIEDMVLAGKRPTVSEECPDSYQALMVACWNDDASERPPFDDVVRDIERQLESARLPTMSQEVDRSTSGRHVRIVRKRVLT